MSTSLPVVFCFVLSLILGSGCGSAGAEGSSTPPATPEITSFDAPDQLHPGPQGTYVLRATIGFRAPEQVHVTSLHVIVPSAPLDQVFAVSGAEALSQGEVLGVFEFRAPSAPVAYDYRVSLVAGDGSEGAPVERHIELLP